MKLVVCSDAHLDHQTIGVSRFAEVEGAMWKAARAAVEGKVDAFLFLGDLCDPDSGPVVFRCLRTALQVAAYLEQQEVRSVWLSGNHCVLEDGTGETVLEPLKRHALDSSEWVHVADRPRLIRSVGWPPIMCLPFTASSHGYDPAAAVEEHVGELRGVVTIGHLHVPGIIPGEETTEMPRGREVVFPVEAAKKVSSLMLNGHFHRRQVSPDGVHIPGSLARLTFGEEDHQPSFMVIEL